MSSPTENLNLAQEKLKSKEIIKPEDFIKIKRIKY